MSSLHCFPLKYDEYECSRAQSMMVCAHFYCICLNRFSTMKSLMAVKLNAPQYKIHLTQIHSINEQNVFMTA